MTPIPLADSSDATAGLSQEMQRVLKRLSQVRSRLSEKLDALATARTLGQPVKEIEADIRRLTEEQESNSRELTRLREQISRSLR